MPIPSDLPPGVSQMDPHLVGEPEFMIHDDNTWSTETTDEDGYIERFAGVWHAWTSNDEGGGPAGHGETPEQAVEALLEQIAEQRDDWPEDFSRDR